MSIQKLVFLATYALLSSIPASIATAAPIGWSLHGVTFDDGGTASGTFTTDSVSGALLSYDITTTAGSILGAFHYDASDSQVYGNNIFFANSFVIVNDSPYARPYLNLTFTDPLTSVGVHNLLDLHNTSWECQNCDPYRYVMAGEASSVPEPGTFALIGLAFAGLAFSRRKLH